MISHTKKEQNVNNFDGLLRNVILSVPSPSHLLLPFHSFKSPVNHMINFQTKTG